MIEALIIIILIILITVFVLRILKSPGTQNRPPQSATEAPLRGLNKEYLIRPVDGEWHNYPEGSGGEVYHPRNYSFTVAEQSPLGGYAIEVDGCCIEFSEEMVGIQVVMWDCTMDDSTALGVITDIMKTVESVTGQPSYILQIGGWDAENEPEWSGRPLAF